MADVSVSVTGLTEGIRNLAEFAPEARDKAVAGALWRFGEQVIAAAKKLVPVDTGVLRGTGHVQEPVVAPGDVQVTAGFGGTAAPYALIQHERTDFHHKVGQAKYLEAALQQRSPEAAAMMREGLDAFATEYARTSGHVPPDLTPQRADRRFDESA